jgi:hypothetical protein
MADSKLRPADAVAEEIEEKCFDCPGCSDCGSWGEFDAPTCAQLTGSCGAVPEREDGK